MRLPADFGFGNEFSLRELATWVKDNKPIIIEMTFDQEIYYRSLLVPTTETWFESVKFLNLPIIIYKI